MLRFSPSTRCSPSSKDKPVIRAPPRSSRSMPALSGGAVARMPATNAKPREEFAGLHRLRPHFVTSPWRMPACRYRLQSGAVGSFIDRSAPPFTTSHDATRVTTFVVCFGSAARDNPQTLCRGWSLPVRLRCTLNTGRAQQRNTNAATGSSGFRPRIHPEPNRRSAFSQRLSQVSVKAFRIGVSATRCRLSDSGQ